MTLFSNSWQLKIIIVINLLYVLRGSQSLFLKDQIFCVCREIETDKHREKQWNSENMRQCERIFCVQENEKACEIKTKKQREIRERGW